MVSSNKTHKSGPEAGRPKTGTLASLVDMYFADSDSGPKAARQRFNSIAPDLKPCKHIVMRKQDGRPVRRTDTSENEKIEYVSFNPPESWEAPYAVQRVRFQDTHAPDDLLHHAGEEFLLPLDGRIQYRFSTSPRTIDELKKPLEPGDVIRLRPAVPHHTWAFKRPAEAWMVFRDLRETVNAITVDKPTRMHDSDASRAVTRLAEQAKKKLKASGARRVAIDDLKDPAQWALMAWGIAERIRWRRERANLSLKNLADACGIQLSYLSRVENATANPSIDLLARLARVLGLALGELIAPDNWTYTVEHFPEMPEADKVVKPLLAPPTQHMLHASTCCLAAGAQLEESQNSPDPPKSAVSLSSWIVVRGRLIVEIPGEGSGILDAGSVLHSRSPAPPKIIALEDSALFRLGFSTVCSCRP